jgi:hypothetical protein
MTTDKLALPVRHLLILLMAAALFQPKMAFAENCLQFCVECGIDCSLWCGGPCDFTCGSSGETCLCSFRCVRND